MLFEPVQEFADHALGAGERVDLHGDRQHLLREVLEDGGEVLAISGREPAAGHGCENVSASGGQLHGFSPGNRTAMSAAS